MKAYLQFLLEASVCLCILYGLYKGFLHKTTCFTWNRAFLIGMLLASCILPVLHIPSLWQSPASFASGEKLIVSLEEVAVLQKIGSTSLPQFDLTLLLMILYAGGVIYGLFKLVVGFFEVQFMLRNAEKYWIDGSRVLIHPNFRPSSFFHYIFLPTFPSNHRPSALILAHEQSHVKKYHSLDLIFLEIFHLLFWFHPFLRAIRKSLKETHEFQVDREMLRHCDLKEYGNLLIDPYPISSSTSFIHYFNQLQIKTRIIMMTKSPSPVRERFRYALVLPCIALLGLIFSCEQEEDLNLTKSEEVLALSSSPSKAEVFDVVEDMPTPPGGMEGWNYYLSENLVYTKAAREEGIEGTVYAEFVVDKSGKIRDVSLLRGIDGRLDAEALNVLKNSPDWNPGKQHGNPVHVKLRIPIRFKNYSPS
jgi:TonB family protein